jgi:isopropylmalate/homocitrate/citramalate synthase
MKKRYPNTHFDFHAHNDYDLAVSNVLAAVLSGVRGLHTTINGLGERDIPARDRLAGSLAAVATALRHRVQVLRVHDVAATRQFIDVALRISE